MEIQTQQQEGLLRWAVSLVSPCLSFKAVSSKPQGGCGRQPCSAGAAPQHPRQPAAPLCVPRARPAAVPRPRGRAAGIGPGGSHAALWPLLWTDTVLNIVMRPAPPASCWAGQLETGCARLELMHSRAVPHLFSPKQAGVHGGSGEDVCCGVWRWRRRRCKCCRCRVAVSEQVAVCWHLGHEQGLGGCDEGELLNNCSTHKYPYLVCELHFVHTASTGDSRLQCLCQE